jgi:hypothetical protein
MEAFADGSGGNNVNRNVNSSNGLENVLKIPLPGELLMNNSSNATTLFTRNLGYYNVTQSGYSYIRLGYFFLS